LRFHFISYSVTFGIRVLLDLGRARCPPRCLLRASCAVAHCASPLGAEDKPGKDPGLLELGNTASQVAMRATEQAVAERNG
jgi:hypothetical protein